MANGDRTFLTREQLQDLALGLGQGLQGRDFASAFGAALSGTVGADLARQMRKEERAQRLEDLDEIERRQIEAEARGERRQIEAEERTEARRKAIAEESEIRATRQRKESIDDALELERRQRELEKELRGNMQAIDFGLKSSSRNTDAGEELFTKDFAKMMGGSKLTFPGKSPIDIYLGMRNRRTSSPEDKPVKATRGMMRTPDGRMVKAVEDKDQETPIYGEGGRDYEWR